MEAELEPLLTTGTADFCRLPSLCMFKQSPATRNLSLSVAEDYHYEQCGSI